MKKKNTISPLLVCHSHREKKVMRKAMLLTFISLGDKMKQVFVDGPRSAEESNSVVQSTKK